MSLCYHSSKKLLVSDIMVLHIKPHIVYRDVQYWLSALLEVFYLVVLFDIGLVKKTQLINKCVFYEPKMVLLLCIKEDQFPCRFHIVFSMQIHHTDQQEATWFLSDFCNL